MNRADKAQFADSLKDKFTKAKVAIFADYKGLSATDADDLRKKLRANDVEVKVLKNNVARLAAKDGALGDDAKVVMDGLVGPTLVAFGYSDTAATAKTVHDFAKDHEALVIKPSLMGKQKIEADQIEALANLPSREVLLGMLLSAMNGPARGLVTVMSGVPRAMVTVLDAIKGKKEQG